MSIVAKTYKIKAVDVAKLDEFKIKYGYKSNSSLFSYIVNLLEEGVPNVKGVPFVEEGVPLVEE